MSRASAVSLALGRIFRLGARSSQPGDAEEYDRCRAIILEAVDDEQRRKALRFRRPGAP